MGESLSPINVRDIVRRTARVAALSTLLVSCGRDTQPSPSVDSNPRPPIVECGEDPNSHYKYLSELMDNPARCEGKTIVTYGYIRTATPYDPYGRETKNGVEKRDYMFNVTESDSEDVTRALDTRLTITVPVGTPNEYPPRREGESYRQARIQGIIENGTKDPNNPYWILNASNIELLPAPSTK